MPQGRAVALTFAPTLRWGARGMGSSSRSSRPRAGDGALAERRRGGGPRGGFNFSFLALFPWELPSLSGGPRRRKSGGGSRGCDSREGGGRAASVCTWEAVTQGRGPEATQLSGLGCKCGSGGGHGQEAGPPDPGRGGVAGCLKKQASTPPHGGEPSTWAPPRELGALLPALVAPILNGRGRANVEGAAASGGQRCHGVRSKGGPGPSTPPPEFVSCRALGSGHTWVPEVPDGWTVERRGPR